MCVLFLELLHTGDHLSLFLMPEGQLGIIRIFYFCPIFPYFSSLTAYHYVDAFVSISIILSLIAFLFLFFISFCMIYSSLCSTFLNVFSFFFVLYFVAFKVAHLSNNGLFLSIFSPEFCQFIFSLFAVSSVFLFSFVSIFHTFVMPREVMVFVSSMDHALRFLYFLG